MNQEELLKSITDLLEKVGIKDEKVEDTKKSFDEVSDAKATGTDVSLTANGGGDVIKNKDEKEKDSEKVKKKKESEEKETSEEEKEEKPTMKKSFEVSEEDYAILQKSKQEIEARAKAEAFLNDPMFKAINSLTDLVKSQNEKIESFSKEIESLKKVPAHEPKSLVGYEHVAKSENSGQSTQKLNKSDVLRVMEGMYKSGSIKAEAVIEYENTKNISDSETKGLVMAELQKTFGSGNF